MLTFEERFKMCDIDFFGNPSHQCLRCVCHCVFKLHSCTHNQAYGMLVNAIVRCVAYICGNTSVCRFGIVQRCYLSTLQCVNDKFQLPSCCTSH